MAKGDLLPAHFVHQSSDGVYPFKLTIRYQHSLVRSRLGQAHCMHAREPDHQIKLHSITGPVAKHIVSMRESRI